jgi:hypothetical protein
LREARGYGGTLPATLGFLPARGDHGPAMIGAFGLPEEPEPNTLRIRDEAVVGVHLTRLAPDGSGKAGTEADKIMVGRSLGSPIVLAPVNDIGGLCVSEGIEDALSVAHATGLGSWAAGAGGRMAASPRRSRPTSRPSPWWWTQTRPARPGPTTSHAHCRSAALRSGSREQQHEGRK